MKYKYSYPIESKELDKLLLQNQDEPIWQMRVNSKRAFANFITELVMAGVFIYLIRDLVNILFSLLVVIPSIMVLFISNTMKYTILPDRITFEWGVFSSKKVVIPFNDIIAINLVTYEDSDYSTIYFGTKSTYKIKKLNYDTNELRAHITFENVKNGNKVNELLNLLWGKNK